MPIRNKEKHQDPELMRMVRKRDQAWELAALARKDADEQRWTNEAKMWAEKLAERLNS